MVTSPPPKMNQAATTGHASGPIAAWGIAALVAGTVLLGALLPSHPARQAAPGDDAACQEWGDGCQVCARRPDGPACSLPGIACTPGPITCRRRGDG